MKISIVGAGSVYTALMLRSLMLTRKREGLPEVELSLMDVADERLKINESLARKLAAEAGADVVIGRTLDLAETLDGADFVITTFRVGGLEGRLADETVPLEHHMLGQETVGAGGTFLCLRTVPAILEVVRGMERRCPDAWLVNYTNPANFIVDAVRRTSKVRVVGLCDGVLGILRLTKKLLALDTIEGIDPRVAGVNHCTWTLQLFHEGRDLYPEMPALIDRFDPAKLSATEQLAVRMYRVFGVLPGSSAYTRYFWNLRPVMDEFTAPDFTPKAKRMMKLFDDTFAYFDTVEENVLNLEQHVGDLEHGDQAMRFIEAVVNDLDEIQIVNVANRGTVSNLPDDAIVEVPGRVAASGITPVPTGPLPKGLVGVVRAQLEHAQLSVDAALTGDPKLAVQSLLAHPQSTTFDDVMATVRGLAEAHKAHLGHVRWEELSP
ncbi:MAG TPA: hypothetical protein VMY39_03565 [Planctomycetota bacterium]|nr:hypothetical protein [Planctomycetota bacterium]